VLRELQPREDRLNLQKMHHTFRSLEESIVTMGTLLAWAQLRSSGRRGAASADSLDGYASDDQWSRPLITYAESYARRVSGDFKAFRTAWKDGLFDE
jgi:uncharacterized protein (DUF2252 family)